jgi:hypothetical protein
MVKIDQNWVVINVLKIWLKMSLFGGQKSVPNLAKNWFAMGGSKMIKNRPKSTGGVRGGIFINFLKFPHFLQKLPPFRPPKSTPINGPIGKPIPHK